MKLCKTKLCLFKLQRLHTDFQTAIRLREEENKDTLCFEPYHRLTLKTTRKQVTGNRFLFFVSLTQRITQRCGIVTHHSLSQIITKPMPLKLTRK